jgi:hypothetical protein
MSSKVNHNFDRCKNKKVPLTFLFVIAIFLGSLGQSSADDFNSGWQASERGDWETAIKLYTRAADEGDFRAQSNLGGLYEDGVHVPQDFKAARKLHKLAADQGDTISMVRLALLYWAGKGGDTSSVLAYVYLDLAGYDGMAGTWPLMLPANADTKAHGYRDDLAKHMSPDQVGEAKAILVEKRITPDLISAYESYLWVKACYVVRKGFTVVFISGNQMASAKKQVRAVQDAITSQYPVDSDKIWDSTVESTGDVKWIVEQGVDNSWSTTEEQCDLHKTALMTIASKWESQGETKKDF